MSLKKLLNLKLLSKKSSEIDCFRENVDFKIFDWNVEEEIVDENGLVML